MASTGALLILLAAFVTSQNLQCHLESQECQGVDLDTLTTDDYNDCLTECKNVAMCNWITFDNRTRSCTLFESCVPSLTCDSCISGEKDCFYSEPICGLPGFCIIEGDSLIDRFDNITLSECSAMCQTDPACLWYTYEYGVPYCFLQRSCSDLIYTCNSCTFWQKDC